MGIFKRTEPTVPEPEGWTRLEGRLVLFNLKGDVGALRGRLTYGAGDVLTLDAVTLYDVDNPDGTELVGSVHLPVADVAFGHELPPTALPTPFTSTRQTD